MGANRNKTPEATTVRPRRRRITLVDPLFSVHPRDPRPAISSLQAKLHWCISQPAMPPTSIKWGVLPRPKLHSPAALNNSYKSINFPGASLPNPHHEVSG